MQARCRAALLLLFLPLLLCPLGCRNNRSNKLENETRTAEQLYREALEEQRRMEGNLIALRQEVDVLRSQQFAGPNVPPSSFGVRGIVLGRESGGVDLDNI